jgi:hypothetical protein
VERDTRAEEAYHRNLIKVKSPWVNDFDGSLNASFSVKPLLQNSNPMMSPVSL